MEADKLFSILNFQPILLIIRNFLVTVIQKNHKSDMAKRNGSFGWSKLVKIIKRLGKKVRISLVGAFYL